MTVTAVGDVPRAGTARAAARHCGCGCGTCKRRSCKIFGSLMCESHLQIPTRSACRSAFLSSSLAATEVHRAEWGG